MPPPLLFSAFVMNTRSHILHGVWRRPDARQIEFNSLDLWVNLAKELEAGLFDVIFLLRLPPTHPATAYRNAFRQQCSPTALAVWLDFSAKYP